MRVKVKKRFISDLAKIMDIEMIEVVEFILDSANESGSPEDIPGFKYLRSYPCKGRIEVTPFRIGVEITGNTIFFYCILHRSIIYEQFP